jgi:steroid delta-isomerase-like uncharacterized protein
MSQSIQQFVNELFAAWNSHDAEQAVKFYAPNYIGEDVAQANPQRGTDGIRSLLASYMKALPDFNFTPEETIVDGNRVAVMWSVRGTHQGTLMNIPPTGRQISVRGVSLLTIENAKVRRATYIWDVAGLLRAVGLLPEL